MSNSVKIRLATADDAEQIHDIYRPFVTDSVVTFEEVVPTLDEFRQRIVSILKVCPYLVCEHAGQVVGYAYAADFRVRASYRWNKEVTVYIRPDYQGRRIGKALYTALFKMLKAMHYGNLLAVITLPNAGSERLHEQFGFKPCAVFHKVGYKMGQWLDVGYWEMRLIEAVENPTEPLLLEQIEDKKFIDEISADAAGVIEI